MADGTGRRLVDEGTGLDWAQDFGDDLRADIELDLVICPSFKSIADTAQGWI
jgi:hypothetical protein